MFRKATRKDFHVCEYCKMHPCMYVAKGEVEYRDHCRHYTANTEKIKKERGK